MNILEYENTQETKSHGQDNFPFNIYLCSIPLDFSMVPLHWHNDMEIIYIKKGQGQVTLDLWPLPVREGDIVVVPPGQLHAIEQREDFSMEYENIIFRLDMLMAPQGDECTEKFFQPLMQGQLLFPNHFSPDSCLYPALSRCLNAMDEICRTFEYGYQLAVKGQLFSFFYTLFSSSSPPPRRKHRSLDRLKDILKYVETSYSEKITIEDAAGICGFSQSHFMKFFKSSMGVSFTDYLNDYRLTMAARMLVSSSDSIASIAPETGFENLSYFNRIFKRKYGCTPTAFRAGSP
ncbi:hypothetical protein C805_02730 [Eubacterium sp. 14-2]|uniref:AraC family transcriptional regulator n=1 Tax=Eubacterium sp. 14-2 TaxID=1235790 RepID=UPI0003402D0F|nr:AraC family transcriptional regulator [Eubacterium sp. 14-2]EOT24518.1 hypothetical protein C805_02730 [Eubacterium sp. 14-2]